MSDDPSTTNGSTATRHPVADLLTDEMRERVRAATFVRYYGGLATEDSRRRCPLAVACGTEWSDRMGIYHMLGVEWPSPSVEAFIRWADDPNSDPADVYVMLGCEPPADAQGGAS